MWEFYLAASEMAFRHQGMMVFQIQLAKRVDTVPLTRDYIAQRRRQAARASNGSIVSRCVWPVNKPALAISIAPVKRLFGLERLTEWVMGTLNDCG